LITVAIIGVFSLALPVFIAGNQNTRTNELNSMQAYYNAHAGIEFALREILVGGQGLSCIFSDRDFASNAFNITRFNNRIQVTGNQGNATRNFSITDPNPANSATCSNLDVVSAFVTNGDNKLQGITFSRDPSCNCPLSIVSMTNSWTPDANERVKFIRVDNSIYYSQNPGQLSGETEVFDAPFTIGLSDYTSHDLTNIQFQKKIDDVTEFSLIFNFADGSSETVIINP